MSPFTHLFISKSRKVNFELSLIIRDLVNVPLVSGYYYVNWKLKNSTHTTGSTARVHIKDHQVTWNHPINTMIQLVTNKQQILSTCELKLEVHQKGGKEIGSLSINLSEYADSGVTTERYLLQDCKYNSTIKLSLRMNIKPDSVNTFQTPPLSRQQIFKDIPSIVHHTTKPIPSIPLLRKSQSAISLPKYCRIHASQEPSPVDLVEQLFAAKQVRLQA
ncbi:N-terminal C2 in EEIG1 and EHBP1 proteins-domain-containing protein [Helicostylum pulchrum]|uniref:C2 NT-type domain-containing protein n=1 Tax=Helicostylum pulchrum TaxID=562976 RepID=A0ABP9YBM7_9FUNG|nr:N-terminal C2 in EEIG1 and EHBP1 proteins-domain-containing protein [Helicostylum pulchrum]